jgi:hypothetical protein
MICARARARRWSAASRDAACLGFCNLGSTPLKLAAKYLELSSGIRIAGGPSQLETPIGLPAQPGHVFHGFPHNSGWNVRPLPSGKPRNERAIWSQRSWLFPSRTGGHGKSFAPLTCQHRPRGRMSGTVQRDFVARRGVTVAVFVAPAATISSIGPATDRIRRERSGSTRRRLLPDPRGRGRSMCRDCR